MKKILTLLFSAIVLLSSCDKNKDVCTDDGKPHGSITIRPYGEIGTSYSYNVYCVDEPEFFNERDTMAAPTYKVQGKCTGKNIKIEMLINDFYYIIAYRDTVSHVDSFWTWNSSGGGWTVMTRSVRFLKFNRTLVYGVTLPATIY